MSALARGRAPALVGAGTLAAVAYVALVDPNQPGHYLTCPLLALTGLYCPGCGGLRAVHDLSRLDVVGAWGMNPLLVVAAPVLFAVWVAWLARAGSRRTRGAAGDRRSSVLAWVVLAVVLGFAVGRNVPALAPYLAP